MFTSLSDTVAMPALKTVHMPYAFKYKDDAHANSDFIHGASILDVGTLQVYFPPQPPSIHWIPPLYEVENELSVCCINSFRREL